MKKLSRFVPTVRLATSSKLGGFSLAFPKHPSAESPEKNWRQICRCGDGYLCHRNCPVFEAWTSGPKPRRSFERGFVHISKKNFEGVVTGFGFTIRVNLRTSPVDTTCYSSGLRWMLGTRHISVSNVTSFFTWLRAKLTHVVLGSFTLSVAALVTLISALVYCWMRLLKLKTSCWAFSQRLVRMLRRTSS